MSPVLVVALVLAYLSLFVFALPRVLDLLDRVEAALDQLGSRPAKQMQPDLLRRRDLLIEHVTADGELLELAVPPGWTVGDVVDTLGEIDGLPTLDIQRRP